MYVSTESKATELTDTGILPYNIEEIFLTIKQYKSIPDTEIRDLVGFYLGTNKTLVEKIKKEYGEIKRLGYFFGYKYAIFIYV
jgi:hypothetical protein